MFVGSLVVQQKGLALIEDECVCREKAWGLLTEDWDVWQLCAGRVEPVHFPSWPTELQVLENSDKCGRDTSA